MSRCFPFPPPGYEKKTTSDHTNLFVKEKHKDKRHKKEKSDSKERKEKDRGKEKHRKKKDRKEKHRGKKKDNDRDKDKKKISNERRIEEHAEDHKEEKLGENRYKAEDSQFYKSTEELGRRIGEGKRGAENQMVENITSKVQGRIEGLGSSAEREKCTGTEMVQNITVTEQRRTCMTSVVNARVIGNEMVQGFINTWQRRIEGMDRSMENGANKRIEGKEKHKESETDERRGKRHKDRDREKKHKGKNKDRDREKEKEEEKMEEKYEHNHKKQGKQRDSGKKEQVDTPGTRPTFLSKDGEKSAGTDRNLKRKEMNGFLHENDTQPNKLRRPSSSSLISVENGKKLDLYHISAPCASDRPEFVNNLKVEKVLDHKEDKVDGILDSQLQSVTWGPSLIADATRKSEASMNLPHPDQKYLADLLCIPKMEEWPEFDDQEWLFSRDVICQKPKTKFEADEIAQVWAKVLQIESADLIAMPYVIPY